VDAPQRTILQGLVRTPPEKRDMKSIEAAAAELRRFWAILDRQLESRDFVCGRFTLADIALGPHAHRWLAYDVEKPDLPALKRWYDRLLAMPIYQRHVALPVV
jgi:glutathione S-transferase